MTKETAKAILRRSALFSDLPERALDGIASLAHLREYRKGEIVFSEGDHGDALYGVVSGRVRVATQNADGKVIFLNLMNAGDVFGEIAAIDGLPRSADAEAIEDSSLIVIRRESFLRLLEGDAGLAVHVLELVCRKLRWTTDMVHEATLMSVPGRLARRLLHLTRTHGEVVDGRMSLEMSQADLANFLGVSRQIVNQSLQTWRDAGWIDLKRSTIVLRDQEALERLALEDR